jgi:hypothetical protein
MATKMGRELCQEKERDERERELGLQQAKIPRFELQEEPALTELIDFQIYKSTWLKSDASSRPERKKERDPEKEGNEGEKEGNDREKDPIHRRRHREITLCACPTQR